MDRLSNGTKQPDAGAFLQSDHEDIEEGVHRMMDEGGGVVSQNDPVDAPILRNDLVHAARVTD